MKILPIFGVCLLLASLSQSGQVPRGKRDKTCTGLISAQPERAHCYKAVQEKDAELFCSMKEI